MPTNPSIPTQGTVLFLGRERAELLHRAKRGGTTHASAALNGTSPSDLAHALRALLAQAGLRPGACEVVLASDRIATRILPVPPLSPKELRLVLLRKAANLVERPEADTNFSAIPLRRSLTSEEDAEERWLLMAAPRSELRALARELQRVGLRVTGMQWERLVALGATSEDMPATDGRPTLVVAAETQAVTLTLLRGADLIHQVTLDGDPRGRELATVLLQEIRGLEAYWRKLSRGEELAQVRFVGLGHALSDALEPALRFALPNIVLQRPPIGPEEPRHGLLAAALRRHPFAYDLGVPVRVPIFQVALVAVLAILLAGYFGHRQFERLSAKHASTRGETERLLAGMPDRGEVETRFRHMRETLAELERTREALTSIGHAGVPLEDGLAQALEAFEGHGALTALSFQDGDKGRTVTLSGTTSADPGSSLVALVGLVEALEASPIYSSLVLIPPASIDPGTPGNQAPVEFPFAIEGLWSPAR